MIELWLNFIDPNGVEQRVAVDKDSFTVGRHSENDLSITDGRLSREHLLIERSADKFVVTDRGSSNGTELNGEKLAGPKALKEGDRLSLGGLKVELEFMSEEEAAPLPAEIAPAAPPSSTTANVTATTERAGGFPTSTFIIAPIMGIVILGGILLFIILSNRGGTRDNSNFVYSGDLDDPPKGRKERNNNNDGGTNANSNDIAVVNQTPANSRDVTTPTPSTNVSVTGKTEQNSAAFLRRVAQNDPKAFITGEQAEIVSAKIKSLSGSSALADNINSARRSSAQIRALATSKNLKPQLLAVAAITKLGTTRGDVLQKAQSMADTLDKLGTQVGNELGDDCLLMMAAYDQGAAGDFLKMRNMLQDLATKMPESSRAIRSIWFLKKNGKITEAEYDIAIRFLAIGTITQNPKEFGVNMEALVL